MSCRKGGVYYISTCVALPVSLLLTVAEEELVLPEFPWHALVTVKGSDFVPLRVKRREEVNWHADRVDEEHDNGVHEKTRILRTLAAHTQLRSEVVSIIKFLAAKEAEEHQRRAG